MFNEKSADVSRTSDDVQRLLRQIENERDKAAKLEKELEHEKTVLDERLQVSGRARTRRRPADWRVVS
jgi:hypothetical protein